LLTLIHVVNSEQCTGEGGGFAEGYEEGFVDLTLGVDEYTTKEEDETANGEDGGSDKLEIGFHDSSKIINIIYIILVQKVPK
jgi:hypothetical protein